VLFSLGDLYPKKQYFSLRYDIYQFIEDHWEFLECGKDKNSSWRQTVKMTLSRYSKLFENGYPKLQKRGFWKLREGIKPSPLPLTHGSIPREKIRCTFNKTIETITSNYDQNNHIELPQPQQDELIIGNIQQQKVIEIPIPKPNEGLSFERLGKLFFTAHQFNIEKNHLLQDNDRSTKENGGYSLYFPSSPSSKDESIEETTKSTSEEETSTSTSHGISSPPFHSIEYMIYHLMDLHTSEEENGPQTSTSPTTSNKISIQFLVH